MMEHVSLWDKGLVVTKFYGMGNTAITVKYRKNLPWKTVEPFIQNAMHNLDHLIHESMCESEQPLLPGDKEE